MRIAKRPNAETIVVAAGYNRSGSTWLYNAIRYCYLTTGHRTYGAWIDWYKPETQAQVHVVKAHWFEADLNKHADIVFTSSRDLRDVASSMLRRGWMGTNAKDIDKKMSDIVTKQLIPWRQYSKLEVRYEEMVKDKQATVTAIAQALGLDVDPVLVDRLVEAISNEVCLDIHPTTLLHPNHITDGRVGNFSTSLTQEQEEAVSAVIRKFADQYGEAVGIR